MTTAELQTILAAMLSAELGTYTLRDGSTTASALTVGEPPDGTTATGLEVRISDIPTFGVTPAYQRSAVQETLRVRLVSHAADRGDVAAAVRKILSRWSTASVREVDASERLGIPYQAVITIPA